MGNVVLIDRLLLSKFWNRDGSPQLAPPTAADVEVEEPSGNH